MAQLRAMALAVLATAMTLVSAGCSYFPQYRGVGGGDERSSQESPYGQ
jgi:hypothetical protein